MSLSSEERAALEGKIRGLAFRRAEHVRHVATLDAEREVHATKIREIGDELIALASVLVLDSYWARGMSEWVANGEDE